MATLVDELTARDLATIAAVTGSEPEALAAELRRRPWRIHDLLSDEAVFDSVLDRHSHPARLVSPVLLFAVLIHRAADELRNAPYVNDWTGPRSRLPPKGTARQSRFARCTAASRLAFADPGRSGFC